jgi:hypothetical protein
VDLQRGDTLPLALATNRYVLRRAVLALSRWATPDLRRTAKTGRVFDGRL